MMNDNRGKPSEELGDECFYPPNFKVKKPSVRIQFTLEQVEEYVKCAKDPIYFIENYVKIISLDEGIISFKMWDWQKDIIRSFEEERYVICKIGRQSGKTATTSAYLLWSILFNKSYTTAILANKHTTAIEIVDRIKISYEFLPSWLQQGVVSWNKSSIELENGSRILSNATSPAAVRGYSINCIGYKSKITVADEDDNIVEMNIGELYDLVQKWKVRDMVLQFDEIETKSVKSRAILFGKSSHLPEMFGWNEQKREYATVNSKRTLVSAQTLNENDGRNNTSEDVIFFTQNDDWQSRQNVENDGSSKNDYTPRTIKSHEHTEIRDNSHRRNKKENVEISDWKDSYRRIEKENVKFSKRKTSRIQKKRRESKEYIEWINGAEKNRRSYKQNKSESRKNTENSAKESWFEEIRSFKEKNERSSERSNSLEQKLKEGQLRVLTADGFKKFEGIKVTSKRETIHLTYKDGRTIVCTPDHLIFENNNWIKAENSEALKVQNGLADVYDLLEVEDVNSFVANDINVHNCVFLDEFAIVPDNIQEEFWYSVFPTISSGKTTKVFIASTPNGMNMFYNIWTKAKKKGQTNENGRPEWNGFKPIEVHWSMIPGRDNAWQEKQIALMTERGFAQEFGTEFLGSSMTLISGSKLTMMEGTQKEPIHWTPDGFKFFEQADRSHSYMIVIDTSHGSGQDYSAFVVFDTSSVPYKVVCTFRNNTVSSILYPKYIMEAATYFNNAQLLIETNDLGHQVVDILHNDIEYENIIMTAARTKNHEISSGFGVSKSQLGVKTTKTVKRLGCANLKSMIEVDQLDISDLNIYSELTRFSLTKTGHYEAERGNDDLVMCCVLFAWVSSQPYFRDLTNTDVVKSIYQMGSDAIEEEVVPFGIISTGRDNDSVIKSGPDLWTEVNT